MCSLPRCGRGASRQVLRSLLQRRHLSLFGDALWYEHLDVLGRDALWLDSALAAAERRTILDALASVSEWIRHWWAMRPNLQDPGDDHVLELALSGDADALVTHNLADYASAQFLPASLRVLSPGTFLKKHR